MRGFSAMKRWGEILIVLAIIVAVSFISNKTLAAQTQDQYSDNLIPKMTSNTSPSGIAKASDEYGPAYAAYKAFNRSSKYSYEDTWEPHIPTGWISYEFPEPHAVSKYTIQTISPILPENIDRAPKDWTFEAWDSAKKEWIVLDTRINEAGWKSGEKREYYFNNNTNYTIYRLNVSKNNGGIYVSIDELEMMEKSSSTTPEEPNTPTEPNNPEQPNKPEQPSGERAILVITMVNGLQKEYDLPMSDINAFIGWYDAKDAGNGSSRFAINKYDNNKGPFKSRTDYVIFNNILTFEVNAYNK